MKVRPFLLEVNHTPSFSTDTPLDSLIKKNLIRDTVRLMNINMHTKNEIMFELLFLSFQIGKKRTNVEKDSDGQETETKPR